jgi:hypothetical protein
MIIFDMHVSVLYINYIYMHTHTHTHTRTHTHTHTHTHTPIEGGALIGF